VQERDALLTWRGYPQWQVKRDVSGNPLLDMQGREMRLYPEAARPCWPEADFIVGNPPFIGGKNIRDRLEVGYAEALWKAHPEVNPSADLVMHWWDHAARLLAQNGSRLRRFGFVTTNSITQVFQRRVVECHLTGASPVSMLMAIPNHPWTKASKKAAAVRIAMTVVGPGQQEGILRRVIDERDIDTDEPKIRYENEVGKINADLTIGADIDSTIGLMANSGICSRGVQLMGAGFIVASGNAARLGLGRRPGLENYIRQYRNGKDLTARSRNVMVIDLFGLDATAVRRNYPEVYQHLLETVKPERDTNSRRTYREKWWQFGEPRREMRPALQEVSRYIVTVETMKHRVFQFMDAEVLPDNRLIVFAIDCAFFLGVMSSQTHILWSAQAGGRMGVGNDPIYSKSRCFDHFPFPEASQAQREAVAALAEELDETRKRVLEEHADLTLTTLYNLVQAVREGRDLSNRERDQCLRGRVLILKDLHDEIDRAVIRAYGWPEALAEAEIVERLVALNRERAAEERRGFIRWLRPEYQIEKIGPLAHRADKVQTIGVSASRRALPRFPKDKERRRQAGEVLRMLSRQLHPLTVDDVAAGFGNGKQVRTEIAEVLASLTRLGNVEEIALTGKESRYLRAVS
jgi:hypothetical protein